ncbi:hypothetical protein AKJ36_01695 [candidate division MSBL1 archaeon SCGC-AAA259I07]|uniref:Uncharacterized protein n=1 Tax=candidate division MSBL1 archaeon SCGC-AAA259I07 TaxID=1698266 RepID=A0A133ULD8_9EURY|nr:hypothetical protein AKJ36_01695 [candidate division MSBL1 archaeon SCGC-AAA259I07]
MIGMRREKPDKNKILNFLRESSGTPYCDDCLSLETGVSSSDRVYRICRREWGKGKIVRGWGGKCAKCGKQKILNYVPERERSPIVVNQPVFLRNNF